MRIIEKIQKSSICSQVIAGLILMAVAWMLSWAFSQDFFWLSKGLKIQIPKNGEEVGYNQIFEGTFSEDFESVDLWLLIQPVIHPRYYPCDGPLAKTKAGKWKGVVYFGGSPNDAVGKEFQVFIATTTSDSSKIFSEYHQEALKSEVWEGLEKLPDGVKVLDSITVVRK